MQNRHNMHMFEINSSMHVIDLDKLQLPNYLQANMQAAWSFTALSSFQV